MIQDNSTVTGSKWIKAFFFGPGQQGPYPSWWPAMAAAAWVTVLRRSLPKAKLGPLLLSMFLSLHRQFSSEKRWWICQTYWNTVTWTQDSETEKWLPCLTGKITCLTFFNLMIFVPLFSAKWAKWAGGLKNVRHNLFCMSHHDSHGFCHWSQLLLCCSRTNILVILFGNRRQNIN